VTKTGFAFPFVYLIAPNVPAWLFERGLALSPHGYFNVECLCIGIIAFFLPRTVVFLLLFFEMLCSFVYLVCYTYQFSLSSLFLSLHYLSLLPTGRLSILLPALTLTLVLSALVAFGLPQPTPNVRAAVVALFAIGVCLVAFDSLNGRNPVWPSDSSERLPRLTMSPLAALMRRASHFRSMEASEHTATDREMHSASAKGVGFLSIASLQESPNVVLIVLESWGLLHDVPLANDIASSYGSPSIKEDYRVEFGTVPFGGLTVPGEARELCHSSLGFGILSELPPSVSPRK
jgi:hypothetical protein